jgi:hypothetical protein
MTQGQTTIPVEFLFRLEADLGSLAHVRELPTGARTVVEIPGGRFEGPRLRGTLEVPGGDWLTARGDGTYKLDVRISLRTDDGALIMMTYQGISVHSEGGSVTRTAPLFETTDPRYAWLNRVQAVGVGERRGSSLITYDVYAVL